MLPESLWQLIEELEASESGSAELDHKITAALGLHTLAPYSRIIDTALKLIPADCLDWCLHYLRRRRYTAQISVPKMVSVGVGHTMPLAICIALLRIHAAESEGPGGKSPGGPGGLAAYDAKAWDADRRRPTLPLQPRP